jgi:hypothetical protein
MDYHRQFRMAHVNRPSGTLFGPKRNRFPASSIPPIPRSDCTPSASHVHSSSPTAEPESPTVNAPVRPVRGQQATNDSPHVQEQVKQLQFWLKVFSRFCNDDVEEE